MSPIAGNRIDPIWHASSCSGEAGGKPVILRLLTYILICQLEKLVDRRLKSNRSLTVLPRPHALGSAAAAGLVRDDVTI